MTDWRAARAAVAMEALAVAPETTVTVLCPACNGGRTGERKLSLTRTIGGAMFLCHRDSCRFRGFVSMDGAGHVRGDEAPRVKPKPARLYEHASQFCESCAAALVCKFLGFSEATTTDDIRAWGVSWEAHDPNDHHHVTRVNECRGLHGELLGHITRAPDKTIRTFRAHEGTDMFAVYRHASRARGVVVVEDPVSAMCVASHGYTGVALLGTTLHRSLIPLLLASPKPVAVFLDPDADRSAFAIAQEIRALAIIGYSRDPKDCGDLLSILRRYIA